jgi:hypothetical protein
MKYVVVAVVAAFAVISAVRPASASVSCGAPTISPTAPTLIYDAIRTSAGTFVTQDVTVSVTCTATGSSGSGTTVTLGRTATGTPQMANGSFTLPYNIYEKVSGKVWGDGSGSTYQFSHTGIPSGSTTYSVPSTVKIPGGQSAHVGTYSDATYQFTVSY